MTSALTLDEGLALNPGIVLADVKVHADAWTSRPETSAVLIHYASGLYPLGDRVKSADAPRALLDSLRALLLERIADIERSITSDVEVSNMSGVGIWRSGERVGLSRSAERTLLTLLEFQECPMADLIDALSAVEEKPLTEGALHVRIHRLRAALGADVMPGQYRPGFTYPVRVARYDVQELRVAAQRLLDGSGTMMDVRCVQQSRPREFFQSSAAPWVQRRRVDLALLRSQALAAAGTLGLLPGGQKKPPAIAGG